MTDTELRDLPLHTVVRRGRNDFTGDGPVCWEVGIVWYYDSDGVTRWAVVDKAECNEVLGWNMTEDAAERFAREMGDAFARM